MGSKKSGAQPQRKKKKIKRKEQPQNENSRIKYIPETFAEEGIAREVSFSGEAYFEVAHNPEKPFIVTTNDVKVEVLGTKFLVRTFVDKPTEVLVTEGKVKVTYLKNGESYIFTRQSNVIR